MSNWDFDPNEDSQGHDSGGQQCDAYGRRTQREAHNIARTHSTMDVYQKHGLWGLIFVTVFGLHDPSQGVTTAFFKNIWPKIMRFSDSRPRLTRVAGYIAAFCFLMTFVPILLNEFWLWSRDHLYASITISKDDEVFYGNVMDFIVSKAVFKTRRALYAQSVSTFKNNYNIASSITDKQVVFHGATNKMQFFRHNKQPFLFTDEEADGTIKLWCFGSSPKPIENLLTEIQTAREAKKQETLVKVFSVQYGSWVEQKSVKRRELESVFMKEEVKQELINDLTVFTSDGAETWYEQRGANYRRGYLFHGKPGAGKTSLIKAIASHFNLKIYTLALTNKSITDTNLMTLFQRLRKGDLLVLEDIDCAGLLNRDDDDDDADDEKTAVESESEYGSLEEEVARFRSQQAAKKAKKQKKEVKKQAKQRKAQELVSGTKPAPKPEVLKKNEPKPEPLTNVTLAGLLNAMDDISSSTGYILIMTTNKPKALDKAVTRAGRVSKVIEFEYTSRKTACEMFKFYFQPISEAKCSYDLSTIPKLAKDFAEQFPEAEISGGQIQDYLLQYPAAPEEAVRKMPEWLREQKERAKVFGCGALGSKKNKERI